MTPPLSAVDDLFSFFHDRVEQARRDDAVSLTDDAALYLAQLLADRARADRPVPPADTLAELHLRFAHAAPHAQAQAYRELGDRALHELACFRPRVERTIVGPAYYEDMGRAAYARLDQVLKRWFRDAFGDVFAELSDRFRECVALVRAVRLGCGDGEPLDVLLARWEETRSEHVASALRRRGLVLPAVGPARA